jgi:branched-chain amino acid transport system ATP-binding protein
VRSDPAVIRAYLGEEEDESLPSEVARDLGMNGGGSGNQH